MNQENNINNDVQNNNQNMNIPNNNGNNNREIIKKVAIIGTIVVIVILVILVVFLLVKSMNNNTSNDTNDNQVNDNNSNDNDNVYNNNMVDIEKYQQKVYENSNINDSTDYKDEIELMNKYLDLFVLDYDFCNPFETGYTEQCKVYLSYQNLKGKFKSISCKEIYNNANNVSGTTYIIDDDYTCHDNDTILVPYEDLNNSYVEMFGLDKNIEKKDHKVGLTYLNYIDDRNSFVTLTVFGGGGEMPLLKYEILNSNVQGDELIIEITYTFVNSVDNTITLKNGEKIIFNASDGLSKYSQSGLLDKFKYVFTKSNGKYYLKDFIKE